MKGAENHDNDDRSGSLLPFWGRGLVVFAITVVAGPFLGALALPAIEALASLATGSIPSSAKFVRELQGALGLSLIVGVPFAVVGGMIMASIVARHGTIGYGACALVAFLVPCVLSLPVLGGLFVLAPFVGLAAALIAVAVRALVGWIAERFMGVAI